MVLQKRLDYRFSGYQVPTKTRATRSARRRATCQKKVIGNEVSAFDLLATVAGKLLQETSSTTSSDASEKDQHEFVKEERPNTNSPLKAEISDDGSCDRRYLSDHSPQAFDQNCSLKAIALPENGGHSGIASKLTNSSCLLVNGKSHNQTGNLVSTVELGTSGSVESSDCKLDGDTDISNVMVPIDMGSEKCSFEDPLDEKPPALICSGGNAKLSGSDDNVHCCSLSKDHDNVLVVGRDDDENCFRCSHPSTKAKSFSPMTCIGGRRIRKILASKYWKVSSESDGNLKPIYHSRKKNCYKRQRSEMNISFKKRKLFDHRSVSNSDGFVSSDGTCHSFEKEAHQSAGLQCRDSHVKLKIKSVRVPELLIEIPETATIGSLKRTVMEAVTTIIGGGLHVGVILQGKKVRDDSKTLVQIGISHDHQLDALGFSLEPNSSKSFQPTCAVDSFHVPHVDNPSSDMLLEHQATSLSNLVESDHNSAPSPINTSFAKRMTDSKALVTVPKIGGEAVAALPMHHEIKRSEIVQRRLRRPFSVAEVEALVQAVEKLGIGRWRDVKLCAFDDAEHRTYVDLKDKWKTLVHTARISPQQRRGEPVPQHLLDRVLSAHHFWAHHPSVQHVPHS